MDCHCKVSSQGFLLTAGNGGAAYTQGLLVTLLPFISLAIMVFFFSRKWFCDWLRDTAIPPSRIVLERSVCPQGAVVQL